MSREWIHTGDNKIFHLALTTMELAAKMYKYAICQQDTLIEGKMSAWWVTFVTNMNRPLRRERLQYNFFAETSHTNILIHCVSKKVTTFKLTVTLWHLTCFQNFYMPDNVKNVIQHVYKNFMLLHYLGKLYIHIFSIYSAYMENNASKLHCKYTDLNSFMHVTVYAECMYVLISKFCGRHE